MLVVVELLLALASLAGLVLFVEFVCVSLRGYLVVTLRVDLVLDPIPDGIDALFVI